MAKALCLTGMVIAIILLALFLFDLVLPLIGMGGFPFGGASPIMDVVFVVCSIALGYVSWSTLKEQG
jgi:hypothetical protein